MTQVGGSNPSKDRFDWLLYPQGQVRQWLSSVAHISLPTTLHSNQRLVWQLLKYCMFVSIDALFYWIISLQLVGIFFFVEIKLNCMI